MRRKYDHPASPDPHSQGQDRNTSKNDAGGDILCIECYAPIHAAWTYVGIDKRAPDLRWRHTGSR